MPNVLRGEEILKNWFRDGKGHLIFSMRRDKPWTEMDFSDVLKIIDEKVGCKIFYRETDSNAVDWWYLCRKNGKVYMIYWEEGDTVYISSMDRRDFEAFLEENNYRKQDYKHLYRHFKKR